jgi:hypothetical protein
VRKLFIEISCALFFAALSSAAAFGQSLLPPMFGDWSIAQSAAAQPATLDQAAGDNAPILREYGFEAIEQQEYAHGSDTISATLYRMTDPTAAYGAFTYLRTPEMRESHVAKYAATTPEHTLVVIGNLLLDIRGARLADRGDALKSLVASVSPKADRRPYPLIADHLPADAIVPGSEKYFLGPIAAAKITGLPATDWAGFNFGAEAIFAKYKKGSQEATLLLIEYPTQQLAAKQLPQVQSVADAASSSAPSPMHPTITTKRTVDIITLAFAPQPGRFADSVLTAVKFGDDVTWNEPSFKAKEPSINIMVVGAFVGTGVILMLAVISGLGFAILRLLAKVFFPGKIFDRPERLEILQLGLTGTRPNTKDLY